MEKCKNCPYREAWFHGENSKLGMFTYTCAWSGVAPETTRKEDCDYARDKAKKDGRLN